MFWETYSELCSRFNKSPSAVAEEIGLSNSITTKWRKGAIPKSEVLLKLVDYFNCSIDYLLFGKENYPELTNMEIELIKKFKILNDIDQKRVLKQIDTFLQDYTNDEIEAKNAEIA